MHLIKNITVPHESFLLDHAFFADAIFQIFANKTMFFQIFEDEISVDEIFADAL